MSHGLRLSVLVLMTTPAWAGCADPNVDSEPVSGVPRVVIVGFDGMDYSLTRRLIAEGKLPHLEQLADGGSFGPLATSIPPQSPVAWSDFITGMDAGGHGIFDFIHRRPETMTPYLSTSEPEPVDRMLKLGQWRIPLSGGGMKLLRRGTPFWDVLEEHGVPTTIVRIPANFPPSRSASRELSGMGTPDVLGGYGTFTFFTSAPERITTDVSGAGRIVEARVVDHVFRGALVGPPHPFKADGDSVRTDITVLIDPERPVARIEIGGQAVLLNEGEWSDWLEVDFDLIKGIARLDGIARFYLKRVRPTFELYVTPINLDPLQPAMPISTPPDFAAELARVTGRYYTQGMPEDTRAHTSGVLDEGEFLVQAELSASEQRRQFDFLLRRADPGLLFYYFGFIDQVSHVMWHAMDPEHPAHDSIRDAPYSRVIEDEYVRADSIVGETMGQLGDDVTLVVMSDHGFRSWKRVFNLNTWLLENGYLALRDPDRQGELPLLANVDWSRTRAYGLGLSGLYVNLSGREGHGRVPRSQYRLLRDEIARKLRALDDPKTGRPAITSVYVRDETYSSSKFDEIAPDLIVGYAAGVRASDATAEGRVPLTVFEDNTNLWSGDHIMDHEAVPGVLFTSRPLQRAATSLSNLAAAVLGEYGIDKFPVSAGDPPD